MADSQPLNPKQLRFVEEYLLDLNGKQAAIRAGYSPKTAEGQASRLLSDAKVSAAVAQAKQHRSARTNITADDVLKHLWNVATADPNELVEYRRTCCRFCYGLDHQRQRTPSEMARAKADWENAPKKERDPVFDAQGGLGWDAKRPPHPACPECFGEGHGHAHFKDTRNLTAAAKRLYLGVKITKGGIEVSMLNPMDALINVGKHLGMFSEAKDPPETEELRAQRIKEQLAAMDDATLGKAA